MSVTLPRPKPTDLVADDARAIRDLAYATDALLSTLAVVMIGDTKVTTNGNGDVNLTVPTIGAVAGVVIGNVYGTTGTTVQQLQVPVWGRVPGAPNGLAWMRAYNSLTGAVMVNHPVRFNAVVWGAPA
jgi:hypothetical protein